jgi:PAT family beta-lactamase induction signal transducer AmpG
MATPNLLATPRGRLTAFVLLYFGEGLPQGFVTTAVALEFKRLGMEAEALGTFLASATLPWAWKWVMGPVVDNLHLERFGRRTQWIVAMQVGMIASLMAALAMFPTKGADGAIGGLAVFTALMLAHNVFAACQDVAIDALAVGTLSEEERGRANGLMFAGAQLGLAAGGSGVLYLKGALGFGTAALLVPACLLGILTMMLKLTAEKALAGQVAAVTRGVAGAGAEILDYARTVGRVFFTTRLGFLGLVLALLPIGAKSLSATVSQNITPTLGMTDDEIATWNLVGSVAFAVACVAGGVVSDKWGRRRTLALFSAATALPTLYLAWRFTAAGWLFPPEGVDGVWPRAPEALILEWNLAGTVFAVFLGFMYGVQSALYMDIAEPRIAATQFTASMALLNLVTSYTFWWQGQALTSTADGGWGYTLPEVMMVDSAFGLVFLAVLPFLRPRRPSEPARVGATG